MKNIRHFLKASLIGIFGSLLLSQMQMTWAQAESGTVVFSTSGNNVNYTANLEGISDAAIGQNRQTKPNVLQGGISQTVTGSGASGLMPVGATANKVFTLCNYCTIKITGNYFYRVPMTPQTVTDEYGLWIGPSGSTAPTVINNATQGMRLSGMLINKQLIITDYGDATDPAKIFLDINNETNFKNDLNFWHDFSMTIQRRFNNIYLVSASQTNRNLSKLAGKDITATTGYSAPWLTTGFQIGLVADDYASALSYETTVPKIKITKTVTETIATPGQPLHYRVVVDNTGSAIAMSLTITDPLTANFSSFDWTCTATLGAACPSASGTGALNEKTNQAKHLPAGGRLTYDIVATVAAKPSSTVVNTAQVELPTDVGVLCDNGQPGPCIASVSLPSAGILSVAKTTPETSALPNSAVTFSLTTSNIGSNSVTGIGVDDPLAAGFSNYSWTCTATGSGATCPAPTSGTGAINATNGTLPAGTSFTYAITATTNATPPPVLVNVANVTPGTGVCEIGAAPCQAFAGVLPAGLINVLKTASVTNAHLGDSVNFTVGVQNQGSQASNISISDPQIAGLSAYSWTCLGVSGAVCPVGSGTGAITLNNYSLPARSMLIYTITAQVTTTTVPSTLTNAANVTINDGVSVCSNVAGAVCSASASINVTSVPTAKIKISKTSAQNVVIPSRRVAYDIVVDNTGSGPATGAVITDDLTANFSDFTWTCTASLGAICPANSGVGSLNEAITQDNQLPAGGRLTYRLIAGIVSKPSSLVSNTAQVQLSARSTCDDGQPNSCASVASLPTSGVLSVVKNTLSTSVQPNSTINFTLTISNTGGSTSSGVGVSDPLLPGFTNYVWSCTATGSGATCPTPASGTGSISTSNDGVLPVSTSLMYNIAATTSSTPPPVIVNVAGVNPGTAACEVGKSPCLAYASTSPVGVLSITKIADVTEAQSGESVNFTLSLQNQGNQAINSMSLSDQQIAGLDTYSWTCLGLSGAVCPVAQGSGAIDLPSFSLAARGMLIFTITAQANNTTSMTATNTANAVLNDGVSLCANLGHVTCSASVSVNLKASPPISSGGAQPIPTLSEWMLMVLAALLLGMTFHQTSKKKIKIKIDSSK